MSANAPPVSVVIPCYNQGQFLADAIESALAQTHSPVEIIVVDDGSTDDSGAIARRYPGVVVVSQENQGLSSARNTGLRRSSGEYIVFLDADDRLRPEALEVGLAHLAKHPGAACAFGRCVTIAADGTPCPTLQAPPVGPHDYAALLRHNPIRMPGLALHRRRALQHVGAFNSRRSAAADYDLYLRLARIFPLCEHEAIVAEYRRHDGNMSSDVVLMLTGTLAVMRAQRVHVRACAELRRAYVDGMRFWRSFYGDSVVEGLRADLRTARWGRVMAALLVLTRHCPAVCARHAAHKMRLVLTPETRSRSPRWRLPVAGLRPRRGADAPAGQPPLAQ